MASNPLLIAPFTAATATAVAVVVVVCLFFVAAVVSRVKAHTRNAIDDRLLEPLVDPYRYY